MPQLCSLLFRFTSFDKFYPDSLIHSFWLLSLQKPQTETWHCIILRSNSSKGNYCVKWEKQLLKSIIFILLGHIILSIYQHYLKWDRDRSAQSHILCRLLSWTALTHPQPIPEEAQNRNLSTGTPIAILLLCGASHIQSTLNRWTGRLNSINYYVLAR